jgi:hypothetical protein
MTAEGKNLEIARIAEAYWEAVALARLLDLLVLEAEATRRRHGQAGRCDLVIRACTLQHEVVRRLGGLAGLDLLPRHAPGEADPIPEQQGAPAPS